MLMSGRAGKGQARLPAALMADRLEMGTKIDIGSDQGCNPKRRRSARDRPPGSGPCSDSATEKVGSSAAPVFHGWISRKVTAPTPPAGGRAISVRTAEAP